MNVDVVYKIMLDVLNKNQNGYLVSEEFNRFINLAQDGYVSYLLGSFQSYQPGRPMARVELGQNSVVRQRLAPVIYGYINQVDASGFAPYPSDYIQNDSMWSIYGYKKIKWVDQDKWFANYNSVIDPIATNPIYMIKDTGFEFAPTDIGQAKMSYVRQPPRIYWGYVLDGNNRRVYSPSNSVDPIWDEISILEIIVRALSLAGVKLQLGAVQQYAELIKQGGQ